MPNKTPVYSSANTTIIVLVRLLDRSYLSSTASLTPYFTSTMKLTTSSLSFATLALGMCGISTQMYALMLINSHHIGSPHSG